MKNKKEANKERVKASHKAWYENNKERAAKKSKAWKLANRERMREMQSNSHLKKHYGLTKDNYDKMFQAQKGQCAICTKTQITRLLVDHDHKTGHVRGLLCRKCNTAIGQFNDDPALLKKAIDYLEVGPNWFELEPWHA